jgi:hypothetical protein
LKAFGDVLARPESNYLLFRNEDFLIGFGISGFAGGPFFDFEYPEIPQFQMPLFFHGVQYTIKTLLHYFSNDHLVNIQIVGDIAHYLLLGQNAQLLPVFLP